MDKSTTSIGTIAKTCIAVRLGLLNRVISNFYGHSLRPLGLKVSQFDCLEMKGSPSSTKRLIDWAV